MILSLESNVNLFIAVRAGFAHHSLEMFLYHLVSRRQRVLTAQFAPAQTPPPKTESVAAKPATPPVDPREREAESKLRNAKKALTRDKDYKLAESFVNDILNDYSDTKVAAEAKTLLEEIKKKK